MGTGCDLAEAGNPLGLVFNAWNYAEQMHRLQDQPHISTRSQQFQARTAMLEGNKRSHNYPDARRIQLGDKKTREPIGERTIDFYSKAVAYLNDVVGDKPLATLENAEARDLVARMKLETLAEGKKRFGDSGKTIVEYFKTFQKVIASATDDGGNQLHPRNWNLAFIGLPKVNKRKQHCPTLTADEITHIVENANGKYRVAAALLAGSNIRISELLALRIEKHVSDDRSTLLIRQQRRKQGGGVTDTLKTPASDRDIDLRSALDKIMDAYIGDRREGFLFKTENGKMLSPESLFRDGFKTILKKTGRTGVRFHAFRRFRESVLLASDARQILILDGPRKPGHEHTLRETAC